MAAKNLKTLGFEPKTFGIPTDEEEKLESDALPLRHVFRHKVWSDSHFMEQY